MVGYVRSAMNCWSCGAENAERYERCGQCGEPPRRRAYAPQDRPAARSRSTAVRQVGATESRTYKSLEELPPELRAMIERLRRQAGAEPATDEADGGRADHEASGASRADRPAGRRVVKRVATVTVTDETGQPRTYTYDSPEQMPEELKAIFERAKAAGSSKVEVASYQSETLVDPGFTRASAASPRAGRGGSWLVWVVLVLVLGGAAALWWFSRVRGGRV